MDSDGPAFDSCDTEVYFSSCDTLVPFKNPSDAAIARLSIQKDFTFVQAVLDFIHSNPSFNSREVTFTSAGSIDEAVAECREAQAFRRASVGVEEIASWNGATSPLAISLVASQIEQERMMVPFSETMNMRWPDEVNYDLPVYMSLVHRSWTMPAQELLFQRMFGTPSSGLVRRLLQHPFCSRIRELHLEVGCMSDDDLDRFVILLRRLPSLRSLSLSIKEQEDFTLTQPDDIRAKIYSEIASCLPNLAELRIQHVHISHLESCVYYMLQSGRGTAPFILKNFSIYNDSGDNFRSETLLSPAQLDPIVHGETPRSPPTCSSPEVPNSRDISKCSVTVELWDKLWDGRPLHPVVSCLFDWGGVFVRILPQISHLTLYLWYSAGQDVTPLDSFLVGFLRKCTSMTHMSLFISELSDQEIPKFPFSSIPDSLLVLSIYYDFPVDHNRASGLARVVQTIRNRRLYARCSLERIEVTICRDLYTDFQQASQLESVEVALPDYLDPVHRMCRELDIDLVCRESESEYRYIHE